MVICTNCKKETPSIWSIKNKWGVIVHVCDNCFDAHMDESNEGKDKKENEA